MQVSYSKPFYLEFNNCIVIYCYDLVVVYYFVTITTDNKWKQENIETLEKSLWDYVDIFALGRDTVKMWSVTAGEIRDELLELVEGRGGWKPQTLLPQELLPGNAEKPGLQLCWLSMAKVRKYWSCRIFQPRQLKVRANCIFVMHTYTHNSEKSFANV